jgi:hypothetical protein
MACFLYGQEDQAMETSEKNREVVSTIGDLVESLYSEVMPLPISDQAKHAMVMVMVANVLTRTGHDVSFLLPVDPCSKEAAA